MVEFYRFNNAMIENVVAFLFGWLELILEFLIDFIEFVGQIIEILDFVLCF
jgi:hypothetical protein